MDMDEEDRFYLKIYKIIPCGMVIQNTNIHVPQINVNEAIFDRILS